MTNRPIAVAAPHPAAVDAARMVIEAGGNAADAAVAAGAVLTVVYPHMGGLGGDAIILLRRADGSSVCVNASGAYGSDPAAQAQLSRLSGMPMTGPLTVSVPGLVSGWETLLRLGGSLPLDTLLAPAIQLARNGFPVSHNLARALETNRDAVLSDAGLRAVFSGVTEGGIVVQPALADTLDALARDGLDSFYRGATAARLADGLRAISVPVTAADLAEHHATVEPPLTERFSHYSVATAAPNSQGYALLYSLGATANAPADAGVLAEIFYDANVHRDTYLADPHRAHCDVSGLLTEAAHRQAYDRAAARVAGAPRTQPPHTPNPTGDTVGIAVMGTDGSAVSLIQSVFHTFGAKLLEPTTGMVLHNRASFFSLDRRSPNRVEAGKRPAHTLVPVLVEFADGAIAAQSTMGGKAQTQIHTQLLLRTEQGASAQQAVSAPRFIVGARRPDDADDYVMVEADLEAAAVEQIAATSLVLRRGERFDNDAGHSMIARRAADGELDAGADPRSDGTTFIGG